MKILTAQQIREGDAYTILHEPIASVDLMERAGEKCFQWIYDRAPNLFPAELDERQYVFKVFCGIGNNGGDGLVIARLLSKHGYEVEVCVVEFSDNQSPDFITNLAKLKKGKVLVTSIKKSSDIPEISNQVIVIDAIFGTGISRKASGVAADVIQKINASGADVVSIDMPSGLFDQSNADNDSSSIVKARYTLTFQFLKLSFMFGENAEFIGKYEVLDIGLHPVFVSSVETAYQLVSEKFVKQLLVRREKFAHKGTCGHVAVAAGSHGKYGAAVLCARAALRSGAGLVTAHLSRSGTLVMNCAAPEIMVQENSGEEELSGNLDMSDYTAIAFGPGAGKSQNTALFFRHILENAKCPLVIDADGINILAMNPNWCELIPRESILTPHPGELRRLIGPWHDDFDRLEKQMAWAKRYAVFLLCKGAHTTVVTPSGDTFFNSSGNAGMATAGSGDVLTGVIAGLLAQGYKPQSAALLGVFLHGRSGDIAIQQTGQEALIASDLIGHLGKAYLSVSLPAK